MKIGDAVDKGIVDNQTLGYYMTRVNHFLVTAGVRRLRFRQHKAKEMAHYAQDCWDAEILTSYVRLVDGTASRANEPLTSYYSSPLRVGSSASVSLIDHATI